MRKSNTQPLGAIIREYVNALQLGDTLKKKRVARVWEEVMGKHIASRTRKIFIKDHTLFVYVNSSIVRSELHMLRQDIVRRINEQYNEEIIQEVVLK
jgi:predicted nucleic acid-binding Zn ribbon protein